MRKAEEKFRLVLADDDPDDCEIFLLALQKLNADFTLEVFHDGSKLLDHLHNNDSDLPHILFLDLNMPFLNGIETLREIRGSERLRNLSVAIYSTSSSEKDIEETLVTGANVYITKPASLDKLQEVLGRVLEVNWQYHKSRLNRENYYLVL